MSKKSILGMGYRHLKEEPSEGKGCGNCGHCVLRDGQWVCELGNAYCYERNGDTYYHDWIPERKEVEMNPSDCNEDMKTRLQDSIRRSADGNGMVCIKDHFGISGIMVRAEDLIEYLEGLER